MCHAIFSRKMIEDQVQHPIRVPPDKTQHDQTSPSVKFEKYVNLDVDYSSIKTAREIFFGGKISKINKRSSKCEQMSSKIT